MAIRQPKPSFAPSPYHGKRMSEREYRALPEEKPYLEYIDGVVEQKPMVNSDHAKLVGRLDGWFFLYSREHGGHFGPESRVGLGSGDYYLPDTSFWTSGVPAEDDTIPTVAVEVRSPGQSIGRLRAKCRAYVRDGSAAAWLIDPDARTVEVFEGRTTRRLRDDAVLTCGAMPDFELPLRELFSVLDR